MNATIKKILDLIALKNLHYELKNRQLVVNDSSVCSDIDYRLYDRNTEISYSDNDKIIYIDDDGIKYTIEESVIAVDGVNCRKARVYLNKWFKSVNNKDEYMHELIVNGLD